MANIIRIMMLLITTTWTTINASFEVYWNIPSFMCKKYQIPIENLVQHFGIIQNENDEFRGNKIAILYDPGLFPAILKNTSSQKFFYRNGGVPQKGNLYDHLVIFTKHINELIPDKDFKGIAIIDFESWRPIYRQNFGILRPYQDLSEDIIQQEYPFWLDKEIKKEAIWQFERAGHNFMLQTLWLAKTLRPYALWGYYSYPYCFNSRNNSPSSCPINVQHENDRLKWLFNLTDVILPSVYMTERIPKEYRSQIVKGRIQEAHRLANLSNESKIPKIYAYYRYLFTDTLKFLNENDAFEVLNAIKQAGANGVILWGSSNDLNNRAKCEHFYNYLLDVLGPIVFALQQNYSIHYYTEEKQNDENF